MSFIIFTKEFRGHCKINIYGSGFRVRLGLQFQNVRFEHVILKTQLNVW
jgi:hypothetical protein